MEKNEEATELAERAAKQGKQATKNAARAAKAAAEPVVERVVDEAHDTAAKLEGTAGDAIRTAARVNPKALSHLSGDLGIGFLALSLSISTGIVAFNKFRTIRSGRNSVII